MRISDWSSDVCSSDLLASVTGKPAEPLDIRGAMQDGNLQAMGAAIQDRMDTIAAVRGAYGPGVQVHPLLPQESKMLANAVQALPPDKLNPLFGMLRQDRKSTRLNSSH